MTTWILTTYLKGLGPAWGPFIESRGNFSGPKSNIKMC